MASTETARPEKVVVVEEIRTKFGEADAAFLTEYRGLTVSELATLRGALRPANSEYKVFKNSLVRRAAQAAGLTELAPLIEGPIAITFVRGDPVAAAKALRDFARIAPALVVKGGLLGPRLLSVADIEALAEIEPRDVLLARLAGGFQAPLARAAGLFQALNRNVAYGLQAYVEQRARRDPEPDPLASNDVTPDGETQAESESESESESE